MELALLRSRGPGLVPQLPYLHELRQGCVLPRHIAAARPPWRVQAQGSTLRRHPRGRPARRGADGDVDPAGARPARLGPVAPAGSLASHGSPGVIMMAGKTSKKSAKVAKKTAAKAPRTRVAAKAAKPRK